MKDTLGCLLLFSFFYLGCYVSLTGQNYQIQNASVLEGAGQSQLYAMLEDSRGYLWLGSQGGGLIRYDGQRTQSYAARSGQYMRAICEDASTNLWLGSEKGLLRFDGRDFKLFSTPKAEMEIRCLLPISQDQLLIGTEDGLYLFRVKAEGWMPLRMPGQKGKLSIYDALTDAQGRHWLASNQGLLQWVNGRLIRFGLEEGLNSLDLRALATNGKGDLWIATYESGLNVLQEGEMLRWEQSDYVENKGGVNDLMITPNGNLWLASERAGLLIWQADARRFQQLQITDGLESNHLRALLTDSWGNHWIATAGGGLSSCVQSREVFTQFGQKEGWTSSSVQCLFSDADGRLWIASDGQLFHWQQSQLTNYSEASSWPDMRILAMRKDKKDRLWLATAKRGILLAGEDRILNINRDGGLRSNRVRDIQLDSLGRLWVATANAGLCRISQSPSDSTGYQFSFDYFNSSNGWPDFLRALHLDKRERVWWVDADGRMGCYQDSLRRASPEVGRVEVRSLVEDSLGYLWGSSRRRGIFRLNIYQDSLRFRFFDRSDGLTSNSTHLLLLGQDERLWVGSASGLDVLTLENGQRIQEVESFGAAQGFKGGSAGRYAALVDAAGQLWFGTSGGLMRFSGARSQQENYPPRLQLNGILIGGKPIGQTAYADKLGPWGRPTEQIRLPHTLNDFQFDFVGIDYADAKQLRYQWKMAGQIDSWLPPTDVTTASFSNLSPGAYTFAVKASDGQLETEPLEVSLLVEPPFWQQTWFRWMAFLLAIAVMWGLFRWRLDLVRQRAARAQERLRLEKNLLVLEQKALQLQMNPHFIFNALNSIQSQINEKDHRNARYQLAKFARLMRAILENSREERIPLEDEVQLLENYLAMEAFSRGKSFDYSVEVEEQLEADQLQIPPMLIQPFVENAIVHGVAHLEERGLVTVRFEQKGRMLACLIEDNGIGREAARARKSQQAQQHRSVALEVTRERLELLDGTARKNLQMEDVVDESGRVCGTRVSLLLPMD
ncbi:MAG: two-component regulator propeller domain-containing protein [Bacteroidota bacterium]